MFGFVRKHVKADQEHNYAASGSERIDGNTEEFEQQRAGPGHDEERDRDGPGAGSRDTSCLGFWAICSHAREHPDITDWVHHGEEGGYEAGQCGFGQHVSASCQSNLHRDESRGRSISKRIADQVSTMISGRYYCTE